MFQCSDPRVLIAVSLAFMKTTHVAVGDRWAAGALLPPPDTSPSGHCQWMATFGPYLATMHRIERLHPSTIWNNGQDGWNFVTYRMFTISTAGFCSSSISVKTCERSYFYRDPGTLCYHITLHFAGSLPQSNQKNHWDRPGRVFFPRWFEMPSIFCLNACSAVRCPKGMVPFCALRAAGLILRMQLQQMLGMKLMKPHWAVKGKSLSSLRNVGDDISLYFFAFWAIPFLGNTEKPGSSNLTWSSHHQAADAKDEWDCQRAAGQWVPLVHKLHDEGSRVGCMSFMAREWTCDSQLWADVSGGFQTSFWTTCQRNAAGWPRSFSVFFLKLSVLHLVSDPEVSPVTSLFLSSSYKDATRLISLRSLQSQFYGLRKQQEEGWRGVLAEVHAGEGEH